MTCVLERAGSGTSLSWRWQHSSLPGWLVWAGLWLLIRELHVHTGARHTAVLLWDPAESSMGTASLVAAGLSHKTHVSQKLPSCPALCQLLSEVPGLTKVVKPCRRHRDAGEEVLCFCLSYTHGQKLRAAPSFCHAGQLV